MKVILIADDEPHLRLLVSETLGDDYEVVEAADGDEAWEVMRQRHPALAILDVQMPGRSGLELTRSIRADPTLADIRVILLSSKAQQRDVAAGMGAGADQYLTKPFSPQALLELVRGVLDTA